MSKEASLIFSMKPDSVMACRLCGASGVPGSAEGPESRDYRHCDHCGLIHVPEEQHLTTARERAFYETHENSPDNVGYVRFLERLLQPMLPYLDKGMKGLDFGCGPGPVLSGLARRQGLDCEDYDPYFADRRPEPPYDFVFATEVFEHFRRPDRDLQRVCELVKPGGLLGVMTERWTSLKAFSGWYYARDPTHVAFYHLKTFDFICRRHGFSMLWKDGSRVIILRKDHSGRSAATIPR